MCITLILKIMPIFYLSILQIITNKRPIIPPIFFAIDLSSFFIIKVFINNPISMHKIETLIVTLPKNGENPLFEIKTIKVGIIIISAARTYKVKIVLL